MATVMATKRLQRVHMSLLKLDKPLMFRLFSSTNAPPQMQQPGSMPPGLTLFNADNLGSWLMDVQVPDNELYKDKVYRLKLVFTNNYPIEAPEVTFVRTTDREIPMHPHIYSNGIICLDLLSTEGWSPVHNVESICVSLQSMLCSNDKNERPPGDEHFVRTNRRRPRDVTFAFHDSTV